MEKASEIIMSAFSELCKLTVSGPGVEAVARIMGMMRQAWRVAQEAESKLDGYMQAEKAEGDDGK